MQHTIHDMVGYTIRASDGDLGKVNEFYFDDATWTIRYMVVETGNWLSGRKVLISLAALGKPDWESHTFSVNLTCDQVRNSPDIDTERPIYRQHEAELHAYYLWPQYWEGGSTGTFGTMPYPLYEVLTSRESSGPELNDDPHLRSTRQVSGYHIHASDGDIGHVEDFIVDDGTWRIEELIVDTGTWLMGKRVLISPEWIRSVNWADASVHIDRLRESVRHSPEYNTSKSVPPGVQW